MLQCQLAGGHVRRYAREELEDRVATAGFEIVACKPWGFPISALYHRTVFEWIVARRTVPKPGQARAGKGLLSALLRIDRLFVGHERGALGYILIARHVPGGT